MQKSIVIRVIILGTVLILSMLAFQLYWVINEWNSESQNKKQSITIALYNVARKYEAVSNITLPDEALIKAMSSNYYVVNINNTIDAGLLERYLIDELQLLDVNLDFEYAIYDCTTDEMVYGDFCSVSEDKLDEDLGNLPKYDEFTYYFGVKFPGLRGSIFVDLTPALVFGTITVLTLFFFVFTIIVMQRQKRMSELQTDFINNLTHEFKTPLSSIKLAADYLNKTAPQQADPRIARYSTVIKEQTDRLNNHIEKILGLAKLEKNKFSLQKEYVDIHMLIQKVIGVFEPGLAEKNGTIQFNPTAKQGIVLADPMHTQNVISNLVDNAVKYSEDFKKIIITTRSLPNAIEIEFQDNGIGISEIQMSKLFNKFYRISTGNIHNVKGFGLGLYYVKNICDAHGWNIQIESEKDIGTNVLIRMPMNRSK